ncbi:hypothetical protein D3841_10560 [Streptococcus mutans]|uniref:hypothetical protein n=2 Tax=Streptococcus mutans TaxID=1309 RepID=UPI001454F5DC|nr:hypothetical protein [Streptococcus mutans]MDT9574149.1 hypothetical protein [Streptococcus mutans]NLQ79282.1 hypothetical protein [Streptococcus mutans]NLQ96449.1 hypothetical protein [Streptococcus mutans]
MAKTKRKPKAQKTTPPRERYHGPLITNGVSLGYLKIYPWISLPFCIFFFYWGLVGESSAHLGIIKSIFLICTIINIASILFSFFHSLVNRLKSLAYILIALVTWTVLMWLDFIGLMMFVSSGNSGSIENFYEYPLNLLYIIPMLLLFFVFCGIYAWYYQPKNQGKIWQFNHRETKDKKGEFAHNFWITFGAVLFVPALLTGYLQNIFGYFLGVLFTATLPAVIVDAVYAAIYIRKHPKEDSL